MGRSVKFAVGQSGMCRKTGTRSTRKNGASDAEAMISPDHRMWDRRRYKYMYMRYLRIQLAAG
jgi:hypothetical protein